MLFIYMIKKYSFMIISIIQSNLQSGSRLSKYNPIQSGGRPRTYANSSLGTYLDFFGSIMKGFLFYLIYFKNDFIQYNKR